MAEYHSEKTYKFPKSFFGKFPSKKWNNMIADIDDDMDYAEVNAKIISFLNQLKPIFEGSQSYSIKIFKTTEAQWGLQNNISTFDINISRNEQTVVEFEYFPMRSDGLPSQYKYYNFWMDCQLIHKNLLKKKLYYFNDDYKIEFVNDIFFNSNYEVDEVNERIITKIRTRIRMGGKTVDVVDVSYDLETLCHDLVQRPKKVAHALYFKNNEVSYEDFINNEKDSHSLSAMINI